MTLEEILARVECRCSEKPGRTAASCPICQSIVEQVLSAMGMVLVRRGRGESGREGVGLPTKQHAPPPSPSRQ